MHRYGTEFIGTFFLVLTIGGAVIPDRPGSLPPLAVAGVLIGMIYAGGHRSRAHYNPAVTVAFWLQGDIPASKIGPYWVAQFAAAAAATGVSRYLFGAGTPMELAGVPEALLAEFLFSFALVFVILNVAVARGTAGNSFYGLAIGMIVMAGAFAVGGISGAIFNPAVALAAVGMGLLHGADIWIHLVASLTAAAAAVGLFKRSETEAAHSGEAD